MIDEDQGFLMHHSTLHEIPGERRTENRGISIALNTKDLYTYRRRFNNIENITDLSHLLMSSIVYNTNSKEYQKKEKRVVVMISIRAGAILVLY